MALKAFQSLLHASILRCCRASTTSQLATGAHCRFLSNGRRWADRLRHCRCRHAVFVVCSRLFDIMKILLPGHPGNSPDACGEPHMHMEAAAAYSDQQWCTYSLTCCLQAVCQCAVENCATVSYACHRCCRVLHTATVQLSQWSSPGMYGELLTRRPALLLHLQFCCHQEAPVEPPEKPPASLAAAAADAMRPVSLVSASAYLVQPPPVRPYL